MYMTLFQCLPIHKTTWAVFIFRILFDNFASQNYFTHFNIIYVALCHLTHSMVSEKDSMLTSRILNGDNIHHYRIVCLINK